MKTPTATTGQNSSDRVRAWRGPVILSYGYRPFFLFAGIWAAVAMLLWIPLLTGQVSIPIAIDPVSWHAHEMLFGYMSAVVAGFLLTAVPNWTGRLPMIGWPLAGLTALWVLGRLAMAFSGHLPVWLAAAADLSFLAVFAVVIAREILAGKNWRNMVVLIMLVWLILANAIFHWEAARGDLAASGVGFRLGLAAAVALISVIGGRVIPSFTRNWLVKSGSDARPAPLGRFDKITLLISVATLLCWAFAPFAAVTAVACLLAAALNFVRLYRWMGWRSGSEPLVWVLHVGFAFVPLGFLATGLAWFVPSLSPTIGAQHLWMAGAIGVMTVAMMTRASLGHSGRPLKATWPITSIYVALIASVLLRFVAALGAAPVWVLHASAALWILAFAGFALVYWPILTRPRKKR